MEEKEKHSFKGKLLRIRAGKSGHVRLIRGYLQRYFTHLSDLSLSAGLLSLVSEAGLAIQRCVSLVSAGLVSPLTQPHRGFADLQSSWHPAPGFPLSLSASLALSTLLLLLQGCNLAILLCFLGQALALGCSGSS